MAVNCGHGEHFFDYSCKSTLDIVTLAFRVSLYNVQYKA